MVLIINLKSHKESAITGKGRRGHTDSQQRIQKYGGRESERPNTLDCNLNAPIFFPCNYSCTYPILES